MNLKIALYIPKKEKNNHFQQAFAYRRKQSVENRKFLFGLTMLYLVRFALAEYFSPEITIEGGDEKNCCPTRLKWCPTARL